MKYLQSLKVMRERGFSDKSVKSFLKTEALLKYSDPRVIQSRCDSCKNLFSPELSEAQDRFYSEADFCIKHVHPSERGNLMYRVLSRYHWIFEIDFERFDSHQHR